MGAQVRLAEVGFTIIEVMLFFGVTGALMLGVLGTASIGVNTQRYNDAVNTFNAIVQQEFTNVTNVVNTKSIRSMCGGGDDSEQPRGVSDCAIIGRLMTIDSDGNIIRSNLIGMDPGVTSETDSELKVIRSYMGEGKPVIDMASQEKDAMSWGTSITHGSPPSDSFVSFLIMRSPRSGNIYSYIIHSSSSVITNDDELRTAIDQLAIASPAPNGKDQYLCVDRSGWVASSARAIKLAPYASGPSGVATVDVEGNVCAS